MAMCLVEHHHADVCQTRLSWCSLCVPTMPMDYTWSYAWAWTDIRQLFLLGKGSGSPLAFAPAFGHIESGVVNAKI